MGAYPSCCGVPFQTLDDQVRHQESDLLVLTKRAWLISKSAKCWSFVESIYHKAIHCCTAISPVLEGSAHGGCISRAEFKIPSNIATMACFLPLQTLKEQASGQPLLHFTIPHSPGALAAEAGIRVFIHGSWTLLLLIFLQ
ncbi:hypothetical protein OIU74_028414 [Salix koriyanagi]|uniref:Uncharacterized protein n=1 Tax=Salix koriyanagi TaxID=2511006 RepID=A0A9Q0ZTA6_9ROSI|nr:hypothetical protein OIU74_028414 [Salix koriyanagi]